MAQEIDANDVSFNAEMIALAWDGFGSGVPAVAAAALVNEFTDYTVTANDGIETDRDVLFPDAELLVEEKVMGVTDEATADEYAAGYIPLENGNVLAFNMGAVYENHTVPA